MAAPRIRLSANLGFLFRDLPLPEAVRRAHSLGFDAVEMHWPYAEDPRLIAGVLAETGMPLLSINTSRGNVDAGEFGLCGLPGREAEARASIEAAVRWAEIAGARSIHVMAGKASGEAAFEQFIANLTYAMGLAGRSGMELLIEPLNRRDAPGYLLNSLPAAARLIEATGSRVKILFDCYHLQIEQGDLVEAFKTYRHLVGHVQFASVPYRAEPDHGEVDYGWLLPALAALGYDGYFGAEYHARSGSLAWMETIRSAEVQLPA